MSAWVVDASILAKLVYPERGSEAVDEFVERHRADGDTLHAPELLCLESASVGMKKTGAGEGDAEAARILLGLVEQLGIRLWSDERLAAAALEYALGLGLSVYDSAYVSVAEHVDGVLVTADAALVARVAGTKIEDRVRLVPG